jgi:hypothetical protein
VLSEALAWEVALDVHLVLVQHDDQRAAADLLPPGAELLGQSAELADRHGERRPVPSVHQAQRVPPGPDRTTCAKPRGGARGVHTAAAHQPRP